jgi:hypothetical protein
MKRWFRLTLVCCALLCLFLCCVLLCLCLSLPQAVGLNHGLQIVGLRSYFDRGTESASDAPTVSVVRSMRFDQPRAGPLRSLILDGEWTASNLGPPGSETHAPPEPIGHGRVPVKRSSRQLQPIPRVHSSPRIYCLKPPIFKIRGFTTAFS